MRHKNLLYFSGLILAGALLSACSGSSSGNDTPSLIVEGATAAVVNGEPIYITDVELEAAAQGLSNPGDGLDPKSETYDLVLSQLIDRRLMAQEALRRELDNDIAAQRRLETARELILGNLLVENIVAAEVNEDAVQAMYAEQVALQQIDDEVRIRHILSESQQDASAALKRVNAGEDFSAVAFDASSDTATRLEGGDLGYVAPNALMEPFSTIIGNTPVGAVSDPFESEDGWHIIKVEDRRTQAPKTLEEMRPEITTFLTYSEMSRLLKELNVGADIQMIDPRRNAQNTGDTAAGNTDGKPPLLTPGETPQPLDTPDTPPDEDRL